MYTIYEYRPHCIMYVDLYSLFQVSCKALASPWPINSNALAAWNLEGPGHVLL